MTKEQLFFLSEEELLKYLIKSTEERYIWYKKSIEDLYKNRESYEAGDWKIEFMVWFKDHLREMKNSEESRLKELRVEIEHCRSGLNPPGMYTRYKRKSS